MIDSIPHDGHEAKPEAWPGRFAFLTSLGIDGMLDTLIQQDASLAVARERMAHRQGVLRAATEHVEQEEARVALSEIVPVGKNEAARRALITLARVQDEALRGALARETTAREEHGAAERDHETARGQRDTTRLAIQCARVALHFMAGEG